MHLVQLTRELGVVDTAKGEFSTSDAVRREEHAEKGRQALVDETSKGSSQTRAHS